jgi:hypothetical protein
MTAAEVTQVLGSGYQLTTLADPALVYRFYAELGVAIRLNSSGTVEELALTQPTIE